MKKSRFKVLSLFISVLVICFVLLSGCSSPKLSSDFDEDTVKKAAEDVISMINNKDSEGLREISTVQVKNAFTDELLGDVYEAIDEGGNFEQVQDMSIAGTKDKSSGEEFAVAVVKAKYEIKTFTYTISFTKQMKLAGLYYK